MVVGEEQGEMVSDVIGIGLVGQAFMGRAHANAYRQARAFFGGEYRPSLRIACGRDAAALGEFARRFGWEETTTDWRVLVEHPAVDVVDIAASNDLHAPVAIAAAQAGKAVFCEKPLARTIAEAREMLQAVESAGVPHMVCFNYRFFPAVRLARELVEDGVVGRIRQFRAIYLQDWLRDPTTPASWRTNAELAGMGALGDTSVHIVDMARYLVGEFEQVTGMLSTFVPERPLSNQSGRQQVAVDDAAAFLARLAGGVSGVFESTRMATGRKNFMHVELNGERGSLYWNAEDLNSLWVYTDDDPVRTRGFRRIVVTEAEHPWVAHWWPPGHILGYEHSFVHAVVELMEAIGEGRTPRPSFRDGLQAQVVLDAVQRAAQSASWVAVPPVA